MTITFDPPVPVLRMFDLAKTKEFYVDYLGFTVDWEHTFEPGMPVYMQVRRGACVFHLSEHHGDGSPGVVVFIRMAGVRELHAELQTKNYKFLRPGIVDGPTGTPQLNLLDPSGNKLRFTEQNHKE